MLWCLVDKLQVLDHDNFFAAVLGQSDNYILSQQRMSRILIDQ